MLETSKRFRGRRRRRRSASRKELLRSEDPRKANEDRVAKVEASPINVEEEEAAAAAAATTEAVDEDVKATATTTAEGTEEEAEETMMVEEAAEGRRVKETAADRGETTTATNAEPLDISGRTAQRRKTTTGQLHRRNRGSPANQAQHS